MMEYYRDRSDLLERCLPKHGTCMEIGVYRGGHARLIWDISQPTRMILVDIEVQPRITKMFAEQIERGSVCIVNGRSPDVLEMWKPHSVDWVYVDASHDEVSVFHDLQVARTLVHQSGIIAGHDICMPGDEKLVRNHIPGVLSGVTRFCDEYGWHIHALTEIHPEQDKWDPLSPQQPSFVLRRNT